MLCKPLYCHSNNDFKNFWTFSVDVLKRNVAVETVRNRAARALGNLAMDPESSAHIHSAGMSDMIDLNMYLHHLYLPLSSVYEMTCEFSAMGYGKKR